MSEREKAFFSSILRRVKALSTLKYTESFAVAIICVFVATTGDYICVKF